MRDAAVALIWLAVNALLARAAWKTSRRLFPGEALLAHLLHATVLCWAAVVGVALFLGLLGWLTAPTLLAGVTGVAGLALWRIRRREAPDPAAPAGNDAAALPGEGRERAWLAVWGSLLAGLLAWITLQGILRFPVDWDTLTYHLPLIVQWLRQGSLYAPDEANWANPGNNELFGLWMVAPFSGDFLITLGNIPAIVLLALGTVELLTRLGASRPWCHVCGWAALTTYPVLDQALTAGNDVAVAGLLLAALSYTLRYIQNKRNPDLVLAAVSLGLLMGVKYYALGYAAIAGASLVALVGVKHGWRAAGWAAGAALGGALLWGSYWYVRNVVVTGTPLYPKGLTRATDLTGRIRPDHWWQTSILGNQDPSVFPLLSTAVWRFAGPCHWGAAQALPMFLLWLLVSAWWLGRRAPQGTAHHGRLALAGWLVATGFLWGVTPFSVTARPGTLDMLHAGYSPVRYGLCFLSLAVVTLALVLHDVAAGMRYLADRGTGTSSVRRWLRRALLALPLLVFTAAVVDQLVRGLVRNFSDKSREADLVLLLAMNLVLLSVFLVWVGRLLPRLRPGIVMAVALALTLGVAGAGTRWHRDFAEHYDGLFGGSFFREQMPTLDPASTHICVADYRYYPFFGSSRQMPASRPLWLPTYASLLEFLDTRQATVVAALHQHRVGFDRYGETDQWLSEHPETYSLMEEGTYLVVYQVHRDRLPSALASR